MLIYYSDFAEWLQGLVSPFAGPACLAFVTRRPSRIFAIVVARKSRNIKAI
jgi:hypothetical protein